VITVQRRLALDIDMNSAIETVRVSDLRGRAVSPDGGSTTLEDPSGLRRRVMRRTARAVALVLGLWLAALLFAGIGVGPLANIPFGHIVRPYTPPAIPSVLHPRPPTAAELEPALPVAAPRRGAPTQGSTGGATPAPALGKTRTNAARPGGAGHKPSPRKVAPPATAAPGRSPTRPSHASPTGQAHGNGKNTTTTTSTTPTTTTTTPGRSGIAPGQARLPGSTSGR
jgi:hypothetical protein